MNKTIVIILILINSVIVFAQDKQTDAQAVDSLFMRVTSGMVMFKDEVEPSRKALIEMGERAIPQMLTKLDTRSARETHAVVDIFKGIGEVAVTPLIKKLKSHDDYVRRLTLRCLGEIKSSKAIDALAHYVNHEDYRTRTGTMDALGLIGDKRGAVYVMQGLTDSDELVATASAVACGRIVTGIDPSVLIAALRHPYYGVRYTAMASLAKLGEIAVEPLIIYIDTHPRDISTGYAIDALGMIGSKKALKSLKQTMKSNSWSTRAQTARALGDIKQKKAAKILKKALRDEKHPLVIFEIKQALKNYET